MIFPSISGLMKNMDSKYTLAVVVAKRARQINAGAPKLVKTDLKKPVSIAIQEVYEGKVTYTRDKTSTKS